jgi:hypothetical protein
VSTCRIEIAMGFCFISEEYDSPLADEVSEDRQGFAKFVLHGEKKRVGRRGESSA